MSDDLKNIEFKNYNILVIGDCCKDVFIHGSSTRLAPEAPVPVFNPKYKKVNLGMAGNVVNNVKALGSNVISISNKENVVKSRYVDERTGQILLRVDENDKVDRIPRETLLKVTNNSYENIKVNAIIISDYNKGFLSESDIEYICKNNNNVFIDTKKILDSWCIDATFIKINHVEYEHTKYSIQDLNMDEKLIITLSDKGCKYKNKIFPVKKVPIKDVSGAGDTFLSGLVVEFVRTQNIETAIKFAQRCATIVVQKPGVVTI